MVCSIFLLSVTGCAEKLEQAFNSNKNCAEFQKFKVFQVVKDGALVTKCDDNDFCIGLIALVPATGDIEYYDDKIITAPSGQCIVFKGVYKYETTKGAHKTVPIIRFEKN